MRRFPVCGSGEDGSCEAVSTRGAAASVIADARLAPSGRHAVLACALLMVCCALGISSTTHAADCDKPLRVAVDIGHSPNAPGARSARGKLEYFFNKRFVNELLKRAKDNQSLDLIVINLNGEEVTLQQRTELAKAKEVDVFLSIHHDSANKKYYRPWKVKGKSEFYADDFRGHSLFVSKENVAFEKSLVLARLAGERLRAAGLTPTLHHAEKIDGEDRVLLDTELGIYDAPFAVLRNAASPSLLFEAGVLIHREEELLLETAPHRTKLQTALLEALTAYCAIGAVAK